jgi:pyruvate dehydrogenase E1 component
VRWNALAMVVRANRESAELGGHIASYASAADLFEVGFNHFFRAGQEGDVVYFQPHSAPGVYARAFLEGRLTRRTSDNYRREVGRQGALVVLPSVADEELLQFPTGSMGWGRSSRSTRRASCATSSTAASPATGRTQGVAFVGDGEMDEPESLAGLSIAARGEARQPGARRELQPAAPRRPGARQFVHRAGAGRALRGRRLNVIKLLWSGDWDPLFLRDTHAVLEKRFSRPSTASSQTYAAHRRALQPRALLQQVSGAAAAGRAPFGRRHRSPAPRRATTR